MMKRAGLAMIILGVLSGRSEAQEYIVGGPTFGTSEPLYQYDDREPWKHGWIQEIPFYGGYHSFRPYNYKHVFAQSAQSAAWGMPHSMPYSQQYYHRYENLTGYEFSAVESHVPDVTAAPQLPRLSPVSGAAGSHRAPNGMQR